MKKLNWFFFLFVVSFAGLSLTGCDTPQSVVSADGSGQTTLTKSGAKNGTMQPMMTTGVITVIHGIPGLVVDVYVNGALTLPNFAPKTVTDPIELPEGNYYIQITPQGKDTSFAVIKGSAFLPAGANASIIAHLTTAGLPTLSVYVNDVKGSDPGKSRVVIRHTANAPSVDVNVFRGANTKNLFTVLQDLSNPNEVSADIRPGRYTVTLSPAGIASTVYGPVPLRPEPGVQYIIYAVGSLSDNSFGLLIQTINIGFNKMKK